METGTVKPLGALLPGIATTTTEGTALPAPSTTSWSELDLSRLPARLDDPTLTALRELVSSPLPAPQACDEQHFAKCLALMDILPRRQDDSLTGKARFALYKRILGGYSNEAVSYLLEKATTTCHWFPTPAECLAILKAWPNRQIAGDRRDKARHLIQREMNARMDEAIERLRYAPVSQAEIDAMPKFWKSVAVEKCLLWELDDGGHILRRTGWPTPFSGEQAKADAA